MKRVFAIRLINLAAILIMLFVYQSAVSERAAAEAAAQEAAQALALAAKQNTTVEAAHVYNDGTYTGTARGYGGSITVDVTIVGDIITDISPIAHGGEGAAYWDMASAMIPEIIRTQNPNVDTISGATLSSTGIHNAVTEALRQALIN